MAPLPAVLALLAAAGSPLDGCEAEADTTGWHYRCARGLEARVDDLEREEVEPAALVREMARDHVKKLGGTAHKLERRRIGTDDVALVQVDGGRRRVHFAAARRPRGLRLMYCAGEGDPSLCARVLEVLVAQRFPVPWSGGPVAGTRAPAPPVLTFGKRRVRPPDRCFGERLAAGGNIQCAHGQLLWTSEEDEASARARLDRALAERKVRGAEVVEAYVPCRLGGRKTECRRTRIEKDGKTVTYLTAWASDGARVTSAFCWAEGTSAKAAPCTAVFEVR